MQGRLVFCRSTVDGMTAAAVVRLGDPLCWTIQSAFGSLLPWHRVKSGEPIMLLGVQFPDDDMEKLVRTHDTEIVTSDPSMISGFVANHPNLQGVWNPNKSCTAMAWDYFFPGDHKPLVVALIDDFYSWQLSNPKSLPFIYGMMDRDLPPFADTFWSELLTGGRLIEEIIANGEQRAELYNQVFAAAVDDLLFETELDGHKAVAMNCGVPNSTAFSTAKLADDVELLIAYRKSREKYSVSIYVAPGKTVDCSALAGKYDGGGRAGAAGFRCSELPFAQNALPGKGPIFADPYKLVTPETARYFTASAHTRTEQTGEVITIGNVVTPRLIRRFGNTSKIVAYVWTNCGKYRVIEQFAAEQSLPEGCTAVDDTFWSYRDTCP